MKFCRFIREGTPFYGLVESLAGEATITGVLDSPPWEADKRSPQEIFLMKLSEATLLAPVAPSKIVCVGRNYRAHAAEMGNDVPLEPLIFFKPPSSIINPGDDIRRPKESQRTDYEGELAVVILRPCFKLKPEEDVRPYILGYTAVNDFTARDLQKKDGQWTRAKGFDTFFPVGPIVTDEIDPWAGVKVRTRVNGVLKQDGSTTDLIFPVDAIIRYISNIMTLFPGDLIATGTPEGVSPVVSGDVVAVEVEGVGVLTNPIVDDNYEEN